MNQSIKTISKRRSGAAWELWVGGILLALLGGWTTWRVMSYATGQDPRIYLHLAEQIRDGGYSVTAIAKCAEWVVPGYPLLLAAILDTFGIYAAYWINLPLFLISLWPLILLLRRFAGPRETALILLTSFWLVITGHPLNPHFIFLPFRGVIEWAFMFGIIALVMPALDEEATVGFRCRRALWGGLLLTLGLVFRETILFVSVPLGLLWMGKGLRGDRNAWKGLGAMCAPLLLAFTVAIIWRLSEDSLLNSQGRAWVRGLLQGGLAAPFATLLGDILQTIRSELRVPGLTFLAVGVGLGIWRREKTIFVLLVTSALLILFYAVYKSHVRYVLSSVGLLALVAGWGFAAVAQWGLGWLKPAWRRSAFVLLLIALTALNARAISRMDTWGPRVTREDVRSLLSSPIAAEPFVFVERDRRHMVDALLAFTHVSPKDPVSEQLGITNYVGAYFLRALDDLGRSGLQEGVKGEDWVKQFFDLDSAGTEITLGDSRFDVCRIAERSHTQVSFEVDVQSNARGGVLWLDFRAGTDAQSVRVELYGANAEPSVVELAHPMGLIPIWTAPELLHSASLRGRVEATQPLPHDLDPVWTPAGETRWFTIEQWRLPSALAFLGDGFEPVAMERKHGGTFLTHALFRIPSLQQNVPELDMAVSLRLAPRPTSASEIPGTLTWETDPSGEIAWRIRPRFDHTQVTWRGPALSSQESTDLELTLDERPSDVWYIRLERVGIAYGLAE